MTKIGLISDTHNHLYPAVFDLLEGCELILHAGDVGDEQIIVELETIAPVEAVPGNTDYQPLSSRLRLVKNVETPFGFIGLTHGHLVGSRPNWPHYLPELFEELETPRAIVYGHSHIPLHEVTGTGLHLINPGAAGKPRFNTSPTLAILTQDDTTGDLIVTHQDIPV